VVVEPSTDDAARAALLRAAQAARAAGDVQELADAVLELAAHQRFGPHPGPLPALLHEAYAHAEGPLRIRLAAALARTCAYTYQSERGIPFAAEAVAAAEARADPALLADALDALLLMHWGPDDLDERVRITARLEYTVALLPDVEPRMTAYLWRLTTALECLDQAVVHRMLRALDLLAEESGSARVRFFAESRRGMAALLRGDAEDVAVRLAATRVAAEESGEADGYALEHVLASRLARLRHDTATLALEAATYDEFGTAEAVPSVIAEGTLVWLAAGEPERARSALHRLGPIADVARDVDWLLTVTSMTEGAARLGEEAIAAEGLALLRPYTGRAVVNAGAVAFDGLVDEVLHRAGVLLGRPEAGQWAESAIAGYRRLGATWWEERLVHDAAQALTREARTLPSPVRVHLHPEPSGHWTIGESGRTTVVWDRRGLHHIRALLRSPGVDIPATALAGVPGLALVEHRPELADRQALTAYRERLMLIDRELDEVRGWGDTGRVESLEDERDALLAEVGAVTGLGGRPRRGSSSSERARVAVRKAVASALTHLEGVDPTVARMLRTTIVTGAACRYDPDPDRPVSWVLEFSSKKPKIPPGPRLGA
jgi:hypothetical protein